MTDTQTSSHDVRWFRSVLENANEHFHRADAQPCDAEALTHASMGIHVIREALSVISGDAKPSTKSSDAEEVMRLRALLARAAELFALPPVGCSELPRWVYDARMAVAEELGQDTTWLRNYAPSDSAGDDRPLCADSQTSSTANF